MKAKSISLSPISIHLVWIMLFFCLQLVVIRHSSAQTSGSQKTKVQLREKKNKKGKQKELVYTGKSEAKIVKISNQDVQPIIIDWIAPADENPIMSGDKLEIKLKIISTSLIKKESIVVMVNKQALGSKLDVAGLYGNQKEFTYSNHVPLKEGENEVTVVVNTEQGTKSSAPLVIHRKGTELSMNVMGGSPDAKPHTSVYWWTSYDPASLNGKPYISKEKSLPVKFKIITSRQISPSDCKIMLNNHGVNIEGATLIRDSQGNYTFEHSIMLEDVDGSNEVYMEIAAAPGARSETLLVNYTPFRPNLHVLAIGTQTNLKYTVKDARDFASVFINQGGKSGNKLFNKVNVDTLIGPHASAQEIKGTIEEMKVRYFTGTISPHDVLVTYISSHGFLLNDEFRIQGNDYSPLRQLSTSVSFRHELVEILDAIPCKKIILIDACHSGGARANPADINFEINKLNGIKSGLSVFASSRGEEQSYEDAKWKNGAFTKALVAALTEGKADQDKNGMISLKELQSYVTSEVATMVKAVKNQPQNPVVINDELGDVSIYVIQ